MSDTRNLLNMIKIEFQKWGFPQLLYKYIQHREHFYWKYHYSELDPFKYELKILTSVVNALTDNDFEIEDDKDRDAIQELVEFGFGMEDNLCTEEQLVQLIDLFPERVEQFEHFIENKPTVGEFYCILFDILRYGYEYLMTFGMERVKYPPEANIVHTFKYNEIDRAIDNNDDIVIEAMKILLGNDLCGKTFTTHELQEKYNYPKFC